MIGGGNNQLLAPFKKEVLLMSSPAISSIYNILAVIFEGIATFGILTCNVNFTRRSGSDDFFPEQE